MKVYNRVDAVRMALALLESGQWMVTNRDCYDKQQRVYSELMRNLKIDVYYLTGEREHDGEESADLG